MHTLHRLTLTLAAALSLFAAPPAAACPNCKEAAASAIDEGDDPFREARAYNQSIYFMLAVPYAIAGSPFNLPAVRTLDRPDFHPRVTFFVGENGSGKSTLLEALAVAGGLNAEGGSRNFRFDTRETDYELERFLRLSKNPILPDDSF